MNPVEIYLHSGSLSEHWLEVHENGQIIYHRENDGYAFARNGGPKFVSG